jgi:transcriptional regulator with XRE-family HTH domain
MSIAQKLLELRKQKNLSQEDLATDLNLSQSSISNYEQGFTKPDIDTLKKYATYFQVSLSEFFTEDNYSFYNHENKNKGDINNLVINQLSEQLLEQFENRIKDKDAMVLLQKDTIQTLKETIEDMKLIINRLK